MIIKDSIKDRNDGRAHNQYGLGQLVRCPKCNSPMGTWYFKSHFIIKMNNHRVAKIWDRSYARHVQMICHHCNDYVEFELPHVLEGPDGETLKPQEGDEDVSEQEPAPARREL